MKHLPLLPIVLATMLLLAGCWSPGQPTPTLAPQAPAAGSTAPIQALREPTGGLAVVHDSGHVTGSYPTGCHAATHPDLPDPRCTPGAVRDDVTPATLKTTICKPGWTATVRAPEAETEPLKRTALRAYGDPANPKAYELDHFIPLELAGSNDSRNLWPEPGEHNAKDQVENRLKAEVCDGKKTLAEAQHEIASNWTLAG